MALKLIKAEVDLDVILTNNSSSGEDGVKHVFWLRHGEAQFSLSSLEESI